MNRREALKTVGIAIAATTVTTQASTATETMNRMEMKPKDPNKLEAYELKHTPEIKIKDKDANGYTMVEITVGQGGIIHPSTPDHWIDFISLYADEKLVGKNILEAEISRGFASFAVKLDNVKSLTSKAGCNLHGIWSATINL